MDALRSEVGDGGGGGGGGSISRQSYDQHLDRNIGLADAARIDAAFAMFLFTAGIPFVAIPPN